MKVRTGEVFAGLGGLLVVALWAAAIGGYIANIVKLIGGIDGGFTTLMVLRVIGIFTGPFGSILGFI